MIRVKYIGDDKSTGFKKGRKYFINITERGKWIFVNGFFGKGTAYGDMKVFQENWEASKNDDGWNANFKM
jgi:hypothetical protein